MPHVSGKKEVPSPHHQREEVSKVSRKSILVFIPFSLVFNVSLP